jgi:hypothetical protein
MKFCSIEEAFSNKWENPDIKQDNRFSLSDSNSCSSYIEHISNCKQCMDTIMKSAHIPMEHPVYIKENFIGGEQNKDRETLMIVMAIIAFTWFLSNRMKN